MTDDQSPTMENQRWENSVPPDEIKPKKLVNPVKESITRQNLHRELLFNQKIGKEVLNQKSELQRALEKKKYLNEKKTMEITNPSEIETTVKRIMFHNDQQGGENNKTSLQQQQTNNEFQQIHAKIFKK